MQTTPEDNIGPERFYFGELGRGRFLIQRCEACSRAIFYPRTFCPHCGGETLNWFEPSGKGTVYATTSIFPAGDAEPYNVSIVDLDEGVRLMSRVVGVPSDAVSIGMRVSAHIEGSEEAAKLVFAIEQGN